MRTDELIDQLVRQGGRARPLPSATARTVIWLVLAAASVAGAVAVVTPRPDLAEALLDLRFLGEQSAALLTAISAAHAALALSLPGSSPRIALAPALCTAIWLGLQGAGCLAVLAAPSAPAFGTEPRCLLYIGLIGSIPALLLILMLRRGFPVRPRVTLALAILAAAALGNFGFRFFHVQDAALMILVWQTGSVLLLALAGSALGRTVLRPRPVQPLRPAGTT